MATGINSNPASVHQGENINMKSVLIIVVLSASAGVLFSGCAGVLIAGGAAVGATSVLYAKGELETTFETDLDNVYKSTQAAMKNLGIEVRAYEKKPNRALVRGVLKDGTAVRVRMIPQTRKTTRLIIRVGVFGDEEVSNRILEEIWSQVNKAQKRGFQD